MLLCTTCDYDSTASSCSDSSFDEEEVNARLTPNWCNYRRLIECRGFQLDTCRDVKQFYQSYWEGLVSQGCNVTKDQPGYLRACEGGKDDDLCRDVGLPDNLFRGRRICDGVHVVFKAVHRRSREYLIMQHLSNPPLRNHPMNHCIPVLDLIEVPQDDIVFIVMEEWSPYLVTDPPHTLGLFLGFLRQHLEHITFMHACNIAHLDIYLRNVLTDNQARYACIDFETSRRYDGESVPRIAGHRCAEPPPEVERAESCDPFKIDVWASGMLILRVAYLSGYVTPELLSMVAFMLLENPDERPTAKEALAAFNAMVQQIGPTRLNSPSQIPT